MFGAETEKLEWKVQESKNQQFRIEIRRNQMDQLFRSFRCDQVNSLRSLRFLEEVKGDKDNYNSPHKFQQLIQGLEQGQNNLKFYNTINELQLETYLCDTLKQPHISIEDKNKIFYTLVELTYYCRPCVDSIIGEVDVVDSIMSSINNLHINQLDHDEYFTRVVEFMVNITSTLNTEVNQFIIESAFISTAIKNIQKITRQHSQTIQKLKGLLLQLYVNLFSTPSPSNGFFIQHLKLILSDFSYRQDNILLIFRCLKNFTKIEGIWEDIVMYDSQIMVLMDGLIKNLHTYSDEEYEEFLDFMNEAIVSSDCGHDISDFMNTDLIILKIKEFHEDLNNKNKVRILKSIQLFSNLLNVHLNIDNFFPSQSQVAPFIKMLLNPSLTFHSRIGKYCTRSLIKLLKGNKYLLDEMIDNGLFDYFPQVLENKYNVQLVIEAIFLVQRVIEVWLDIKNKEGAPNITEIFYAKGLIGIIEDFQNSPENQLYEQSEMFMKWFCEI